MSAWELDQWFVAYTIEPWGDRRADLRMAVQTAALVNIQIPKDQASKAVKPSDYLLFDWSAQSRVLTPDETADLFAMLLNVSDQPPAA